jgi:hypothetical protein
LIKFRWDKLEGLKIQDADGFIKLLWAKTVKRGNALHAKPLSGSEWALSRIIRDAFLRAKPTKIRGKIRGLRNRRNTA